MRIGTKIVWLVGLIGAAAIGSTADGKGTVLLPAAATIRSTAMAGELGTAARRAIRCKAASVSPIEVPSAAGGALGTVVRPAIRSRVASASRIVATRNRRASPPKPAKPLIRTAAQEERSPCQKARCKCAEILPQKDRASNFGFRGWLQMLGTQCGVNRRSFAALRRTAR